MAPRGNGVVEFGFGLKMGRTTKEWEAFLKDAYIWFDFVSMPQPLAAMAAEESLAEDEYMAPHMGDHRLSESAITDAGETLELIEGCLSVPGWRGQVSRHARVKVRARRPDGSAFEVHASGHAAATLQHENDHLNGVLFPDVARVGPFGAEKLMSWAAFDEHYSKRFLPYALELRDRYPEDGPYVSQTLPNGRTVWRVETSDDLLRWEPR